MTLLRRALVAALFAAAVPLFAAEPWDAPPFSADPKALVEAAKSVSAGDADLIVLFDDGSYSVEPDGRTRTRSRLVYRVVTAKGVEMLDSTGTRWQPWFDERPEIRARVVAPDGSVHTLDPKSVTEASAEYERSIFSDDRILHAPLPGVAVGAVVEIVIDHVGKSVLPGAGTSGTFVFAGPLPEEHVRLTLEGPAATFAPHIVNKAGVEPRIVEKDGRKQIIFEHGHANADNSDESYLASDDMLYPYVAFSTGTSWSELARGYADIVDKQIAAADVKEIAAAAARGAMKREEIADRLLAYVEANVHYAGVEVGDGSIVPRVPAGVLKNKYGDCKDKATLLVALLRAAGLPAHVALLSAGFDFDVINELPAMNHFNHAIVVVGGESPIWIDPTDEFARAGALPEEDQGRMALVAAPETTSLTRTPELPSAANRYVETRTFTLPEEGKAHVVEVTTATAGEEAGMRRHRAESEADKYKTEIEKYAKGYYVARSLDKFDVTDPRDLSKPFALTLEVSDSQMGVVENGDGAVGVNLRDIAPVPAELRDYEEPKPNDPAPPAKKRQHDFVFPQTFVKEWTYRIVLPPGYKSRRLPENETKHLGTTTLTKEYALESDSVVVAKFRFDSGKRRLKPAEFEETRIALSKLLEEKQIILGFDSIGQAKLSAGDVRGALDEFRRLAALHPKEAQHHIEISRALLVGGLGEAAREEARRAVAIEPSSARAHFALAITLERDLLGRPFHSGFDLAGAIAEARKAKQLDGTDLARRVELPELLAYGEDGFRFGRSNHLAEAIDEYKVVLKDFGEEAKHYEPRLMLFYAYAGRWDEVKKLTETISDGDQKNQGRILAAAATGGASAALHELDGFGGEQRRRYAGTVAMTLTALGRYPEAAALLEVVAQGAEETSNIQPLLAAVKKSHRGPSADDTPVTAVMKLFRAMLNEDSATMKSLLPASWKFDAKELGFNPKAIPMGELTPDILADIFAAMADVQTDGSDTLGYRIRLNLYAGPNRHKMTWFVQRDGAKYIVTGLDVAPSSVGEAVLKMADAGKVDAARTWLNWLREEYSAGGGDDPLAGDPFPSLWPKDKQTATAAEARLGAAALMSAGDTKKESLPILLAARDSATDEQKKWIDVALYSAYDDWAKSAEIAGRLLKSYPDSPRAFVSYVTALARSGKVDEAEAAAKERLQRTPRSHEAMTMLSSIAARRADYASAAAYVRRVIDELTPTDNDYNNAAWIALFTGKDVERAIEDARRASSATARGAAAASLHTLAALYAESGKNLEARQALLQSMEKRMGDTPSPSDWYVIGRMAENYGVPEAAAAAYKRVEKTPPDGLTTFELAQRRLAALK